MKKSLKISFLALIAVICFAFVGFMPIHKEVANAVSMESSTDSFQLSDTAYTSSDKFVYTATVSFETGEGVAAGLVFGAEQDSHYWVFNVDRKVNRVKLIYFSVEDGQTKPKELMTDYFIGNDKMTESERNIVGAKVAYIDKVQLKVIITPEADKVYAEFYADNIRRFGVDNTIDLNTLAELPTGVSYNGGKIGFNCFNSKVTFNDIHYGISDYSYYTELYRNQYHFSQYAHWNNDPNGLVYYNGYYHLYYQHHPYNNNWGDMYWGHARSTDLAHWELLPICLFPDEDWSTGVGYMWSGSAYEYRKGDSTDIDNLNWFPNGDGNGLIAFYTRDGGMQDQILMSSDDSGMTWTKRKLIGQTVATGQDGIWGKEACRDPKIFPLAQESGKTTVWGMALTGQQANKVWFLKSTNLLDWSYAGKFSANVPECPDVVTMTADDGQVFTVITLTAREYILTKMSYNDGVLTFTDKDGGEIDQSDFQKMDFGADSYAAQTFSIRDTASAYYGKIVSLSWYAGVPADTDTDSYKHARKVWNGGGMTIPVIWNLVKEDDGYILTQTPIVKDSTAFSKTNIINVTNQKVNASSENILSSIDTHVFEMDLKITNPDDANVSIKINVGDNEYTEIGWNKTEGYFVDRTHTSSAGLSIRDYRNRYTSGPRSSGAQNFYILSDNGGVEVFCDDFKIPFYVLTLASPYSVKAEFKVDKEVTVDSLKVNEIASIWRTGTPVAGETVLYVSDEYVELDTALTTEKQITAYSTSGEATTWQITEGNDVISIETVSTGTIKIKSLKAGNAVITATCGNQVKTINVTVYEGNPQTDLPFNVNGIVSGQWIANGSNIVATASGDGYLLSSKSASDFDTSVTFSLEAVAGAFIFRASADMSEYIIFNYDNNEKIVKMWSQNGEIGRASAQGVDTSNVTLRVEAVGKLIKAYLNGNLVIEATLDADEPTDGFFGLNAYSGKVTFKNVEDSTLFFVSDKEVQLDSYINSEQFITVRTNSSDDIVYEITEGEDVVSLEEVTGGIILRPIGAGNAVVKATCAGIEKTIYVTAYTGTVQTDVSFALDGILAGSWYADGEGLVGRKDMGDGYILSSQGASDFDASATFALEAKAAAIIFRANEDMSKFIIFNYDNNERVVKMWSQNGEIARVNAPGVDLSNITLRVEANGTTVKGYVNDTLVIDATLDADEPTEGLYGLNVFDGKATFKSIETATLLQVSEEEVHLDTAIAKEQLVTAYTTSSQAVVWEVTSGYGVVSLQETTGGVIIKALSAGSAIVTATCDGTQKNISVTVHSATLESDIPFNSTGVIAGSWNARGTELIGQKADGDGYILSTQSATDFSLSVIFSLDGAAGALIFRANADMSEYIMFNYDNNAKVAKMWSHNGEISVANAPNVNPSNVVLRVEAKGTAVKAYVNGNLVINVTLGANEPTEGLFGLNVCAGSATFKSILNFNDKYTYNGNGDLNVIGDSKQVITSLYNKTLSNAKIDAEFFTSAGRTLTLKEEYFELLSAGVYTFKAVSGSSAYEFTVTVTAIPQTNLQDATVQKGTNAVIYLGNVEIESVKVNGKVLTASDYKVENKTLTIYANVLTEESNEVVINGNNTVKVTVIELPEAQVGGANLGLILGLSIGGGVLLSAGVVVTIVLVRRKKKVGNDD